MATASAFVTVRCRGCNEPRQLTARSSRRAGLCKRCLHPQKVEPTDTERRWWLRMFSDSELASIASEFVGYSVPPSTFTPHRVALLGSADPPKP